MNDNDLCQPLTANLIPLTEMSDVWSVSSVNILGEPAGSPLATEPNLATVSEHWEPTNQSPLWGSVQTNHSSPSLSPWQHPWAKPGNSPGPNLATPETFSENEK